MSDTVTVVLGEVERFDGSNDKGPWSKFTFKDGNGQVVGTTFDKPLGTAASALKGERVEIDTEPARDPKYAPTVKAVRPAPEAAVNGDGGDKMSKAEWRAKDRAADKRACIAIACSAFGPQLSSSAAKDDVENYAARVIALARIFFGETTKEYVQAVEDAGIDIGAGTPIA